MKNSVLEELIGKWEYQCRDGQTRVLDESENGKMKKYYDDGFTDATRQCAKEIRELMRLLPDSIITN